MDRATIEPAIRSVQTEIHSKLNEAARIAKAAEACALERFSVDVNRNNKGVPRGAQIRFGLL